jgi:hypothetical protein
MKKTTKKLTAIMAAMLTVATVGATAAMPVFAEENPTPSTDTSAASTATKLATNDDGKIIGMNFDKTLTATAGSTVPDAKFKFTMVPATEEQLKSDGTNVDELLGKTVQAGPALTTDSVELEFSSKDTTTGTKGTSVSVTKEGTFTLPVVGTGGFTEEGVYRYAVAETGDTDDLANMVYDTDVQLVDVFVFKDSNGDLAILGITNHEKTAEGELASGKSPIEFFNSCEARPLTIEKEVTGSGSSTEAFSFKVNVAADDNLTAGATLLGVITDQDGGTTNVDVVVGSDYEFQLKDGEKLQIFGLFDETNYTVTETAVDGYSTKVRSTRYDATEDKQKTSTAEGLVTTGEVKGAGATEHYINHATTNSTGVVLTITPIAIAGGLAAAGAILVVTKRKLKK